VFSGIIARLEALAKVLLPEMWPVHARNVAVFSA
jgi:hypothetical protein